MDANGALQSLALGLQDNGGIGGGAGTPDITAVFGGIAPMLSQVTVTIDGSSRSMFGLGLRETFPAGTCVEALFVDPAFPPPPGQCTPPHSGVALVLWETHAANQPPDRMVFVIADEGTTNFDVSSVELDPTSPQQVEILPAFAIYAQGENDVWSSISGTLTTAIAGQSQTCSIPLPPYAKSGVCNFASFDEQGQIVFEPFTFDEPSTKRLTIAIPRQTLNGLWLNITEVQPITFPLIANRGIRGMLTARLGALASSRSAPAR